MQKTRFFAVFGVKLYRELIFFLKNHYGAESTTFTLQNPFWIFQISFFLEILFNGVEYFAVFVNTTLPKKSSPGNQKKKCASMFLRSLNPDPTSELPHHLRFFKFSNLKVQNTQFFAILHSTHFFWNFQ